MPLRSNWILRREGLTFDTLSTLVKLTILNPAITLPLVLLAHFTNKGKEISLRNEQWLKRLRLMLWLGLLEKISAFWSVRELNNWIKDEYVWNREIIVVTGGSDGMGGIMVKLFAEKGIKVCVIDVQPLQYEAPPGVHFYKCDLTSHSDIVSTTDKIRSEHGNPTVLINNAGIGRGKPILETTEKDLNLTFQVNTFAHYYLVQQFLPSMIENNHGTVVTVASTAAYVTAPRMVDYAGSKAAALAFHEGLHAELASTYNAPKVRTIVCCPGWMATKLFEGFRKGDKLFNYPLTPETVAEETVKAVLAGKSKHICLPEMAGAGFSASLRFLPVWLQYNTRKGLVKLMTNWKGRQVPQPSDMVEEKKDAGSESFVQLK